MSEGGNDVGARLSMNHCLFGQYGYGLIVHDIATCVDQTVLAMAGVRVERNIRDDAQFGEAAFQCGNGARYQPVRVECFFSAQCFQIGAYYREQCQCGDTQLHAFFGHGEQQVERQPLNAGHGGY